MVAAVLVLVLVGCGDGTHIDREASRDEVGSLVAEILSIERCDYLFALNEDVLVPTDFAPEEEERITTAFDETSQLLRCGPTPSTTAEVGTTGPDCPDPEDCGQGDLPMTVEVFGGLSVELQVPPSVRSGGELMATLHVENRSGGPVTDPACQLREAAAAIVPVNDPEAELWMVTQTECNGPFTYEEGAVDDVTWLTFKASTKFGDPLRPGNYFAVLEVDGQRLSRPIQITSP